MTDGAIHDAAMRKGRDGMNSSLLLRTDFRKAYERWRLVLRILISCNFSFKEVSHG